MPGYVSVSKPNKAGKRRWQVMINGEIYYSKRCFRTKKAAEDAEVAWLRRIERGGAPPTPGLQVIPTDSAQPWRGETVLELLDRRLDYLKGRSPNSPHYLNTKNIFARAMRFGDFWDRPAAELTHEEVWEWAADYNEDQVEERSNQPGKDVNRCLSFLATAFNGPWHTKRATREYPQNPFLVEQFPQDNTQRYVPPDRDAEAVLSLAPFFGTERWLFLNILANTAARQGEARRLRWVDLEWDRGMLTLWTRKKSGGTKKPRRLPVGSELVRLFRLWRTCCPSPELLFPGEGQGGHKKRRWALDTQDNACAFARVVRFTPHSWRHWRACKWADEGLRLSQIRVRLGHETLRQTEQYLATLGVETASLDI